ncbi:hypothetical protein CRM22_010450 [Opisthorchis felineus]|uniref:Uncharacterized protein n=1 Tax=Opisthorchis felineus TaxID=147828 RepID=A0A4S2L422_OPIFE|nr:hypothetical protein CRM22_010450 [Opisthorchis felineus]
MELRFYRIMHMLEATWAVILATFVVAFQSTHLPSSSFVNSVLLFQLLRSPLKSLQTGFYFALSIESNQGLCLDCPTWNVYIHEHMVQISFNVILSVSGSFEVYRLFPDYFCIFLVVRGFPSSIPVIPFLSLFLSLNNHLLLSPVSL